LDTYTHRWDTNLTAEALSFFKGRSETKMATIRHSVVRNAHTLREVKSEVAMEEQCSAGTAIQSWVIDGSVFFSFVGALPTPRVGRCLVLSTPSPSSLALSLSPAPAVLLFLSLYISRSLSASCAPLLSVA